MQNTYLELRKVRPDHAEALAAFFRVLRKSGSESFFHPHPLTDQEALKIATYQGNDLYYVLLKGSEVIGYGMLGGWDEGYQIPSLGIAIHPRARGKGLARSLMSFLHSAAALRGAARIRLKVDESNSRARDLYPNLGYRFRAEQDRSLIGFLDLVQPKPDFLK
jgi:ribosomal protein S18 acetylase RimI-like enzyme